MAQCLHGSNNQHPCFPFDIICEVAFKWLIVGIDSLLLLLTEPKPMRTRNREMLQCSMAQHVLGKWACCHHG
eukprot:scaffold15315_cov36-Cyclotella_meneghiniana.AAC.3